MKSRKIMSMASVLAAVVLIALGFEDGIPGARAAEAQQKIANGADAFGFEERSIFDAIIRRHYPELQFRDAPAVLKDSGIICMYGVAELPYGEDMTWEMVNRRFVDRSPYAMVRTFPTLDDMRYLMSLSDLDVDDILEYDELLASGRRDVLIASLSRLIDPRMDQCNKAVLEGYDPNLCINEARTYVYSLRIDESVLKVIRGKRQLFHEGKYEKYRSELTKFLADYPNLSMLHAGIGNSYFAEGRLEQAREWYGRGLAANPLNPMLEYSLAMCHLAEGDAEQAIDSLVESIFACRNDLLSWAALECLLSEKGSRIADRRFRNMVLVRSGTAEITISNSVSPGVMESWIYYGAAEIATRHERSESWVEFKNWKPEVIEYYKVAHLLGMYMHLKSKAADTFDSYLDDLETIYRSGYLKEYVLFDKVTPYMHYHLISMLSEQERSKLRQYFDRFIISG